MALVVLPVDPTIAADSLSVNPSHPTTSDSIRLSIFITNANCCSQFTYDSTAVTLLSDSTITLEFTADLSVVCPCPYPVTIPVLKYKRGPLPAGKYSVFAESQSCVGIVCTDSLALTSIGSFTVSQPLAASYQEKSMPLEDIGKMPGNSRVYNIRGDVISSDLAGASKRASGVYFVKPSSCADVKMKIWY